MKKTLLTLTLLVAACFFAAACGNSKYTRSTIELKSSGEVVEYTVEDFSASYYDYDELKTFVEEEINSFNEEKGEELVKLKDISEDTEKDKETEATSSAVNMVVKYDSLSVFAEFTGTEYALGSPSLATENGMSADTEFWKLRDNDTSSLPIGGLEIKLGDTNTDDTSSESDETEDDGETDTFETYIFDDIENIDEFTLLAIRTFDDVVVPGDVYYVSADGVENVEDNIVYIEEAESSSYIAKLVYILYK